MRKHIYIVIIHPVFNFLYFFYLLICSQKKVKIKNGEYMTIVLTQVCTLLLGTVLLFTVLNWVGTLCSIETNSEPISAKLL